MAKRGRKPKEKKNYFCEDEESALVQYLEAKDNELTPESNEETIEEEPIKLRKTNQKINRRRKRTDQNRL